MMGGEKAFPPEVVSSEEEQCRCSLGLECHLGIVKVQYIHAGVICGATGHYGFETSYLDYWIL